MARSEDARFGRASHGELIEIGFSKEDGSVFVEFFNDVRIVRRMEISQHPRPAGGRPGFGAEIVFDGDGDTGQGR